MRFPGLAALFLSALLISSVSANKCEQTRVRKEWRDLTREEQLKYISAVKAAMKPQAGGLPSKYDLLSKMHGDNAMPLHVHPVFLPWHRAFIFWYENTLRHYDASVTLTYWDWAHDAQEPQSAPVWGKGPHQFGVNGDPDNDNCVTTGAFAGWKPKYPEDHCLKRVWRHQVRTNDKKEMANTISAFVNSEMMNSLLAKSKTFGEAAKAIELTPHGTVHNNIGGDMLSMYSPNEPLFYLHHTNIDRIWDAWQRLDAKNVKAYGGKNHNRKKASLKDSFIYQAELDGKKIPVGGRMTVGNVMDNKNFVGVGIDKKKIIYCIVYQPRQPKRPPPPPQVAPRPMTRPAPRPGAPRPAPVRRPPVDEEGEETPRPAPPRPGQAPPRPPQRPAQTPRRPPPPPVRRPPVAEEEEYEEEEEAPRRPSGPRRYVRPVEDEYEEEEERPSFRNHWSGRHRNDRRNRWGQQREEEEEEVEERRLVRLLRRRLAKQSEGEAVAKDTSTAIHAPEAPSKAWLAMNGIAESEVLKQLVIVKETTNELAAIYAECGFIPPDSEIGNRDTSIKEIKDKKRTEFKIEFHGKKITLKVKEAESPEDNYKRFVKELQALGLTFTLNEGCAKKVAAVTGPPVKGIASNSIAAVTKEVAKPLESLTKTENKVTNEATQQAKQDAKEVEKKSPSGALNVENAAGNKLAGGNPAGDAAAKQTEAGIAKQNEISKTDTNPKTAATKE